MKHWLTILMVAALAPGCASNEEDPAPRTQELSADQTQPVVAPEPEPTHAEEIAGKRAYRTPAGPTVDPIDREAAAAFRKVDAAAVDPAVREKLVATGVPVLVPDDPALLESMGIVARPHWYAARFEHDGVDVHIRGTRASFEVEGMEISEAAREAGANYTLTRTHGIVTVSFRDFGASYSMDVECHGAADDPRCLEDDFALELAESLGLIEGGRL